MRIAIISICFYLILVEPTKASPVPECSSTESGMPFFGEQRQLAYDWLEIPEFAKKIKESTEKLNKKIHPDQVPDWEFSDQVHRVITTRIIELKTMEFGIKERANIFEEALQKSFEFNVNYSQKKN